jgi:glycosyltransferase involved in cell wall biosynthesis
MNINKQKIYFFCDDYKIPFVINEIENLSQNFDKVVLVSLFDLGDLKYENVERLKVDFSNYSAYRLIIGNLKLFSQIFLLEILFNPIYLKYKKPLVDLFREFLQSIYIKDYLKTIIENEPYKPIYYSFWFNKWATVLSILSMEKIIDSYYSRVHGADLYEERKPLIKKLPFRKFQLKYVKKVFSVSKKGEEYLKNKYPIYQDKIAQSYLGTKERGENPFFINQQQFTIVSCAKIRNIKRIHLLAELIYKVDFPIKWIHIGDENLNSNDPTIKIYSYYKDLIQNNSNVEYIAKGDISNDDVMKLYKNTPINLFVSLSETEGLPISMMEAISFGIPILSTNVGGCSEIVTHKSGILVDCNFSQNEFISIIKNFCNSNLNSLQSREKIKEYWRENFNNEINFSSFLNIIKND